MTTMLPTTDARTWADVPRVPGTTLGSSWRWSTDAHRFLDRCAREYGNVFRLKLLVPGETMFFATATAARTVFTVPPDRVDAGVTTGAVLKPVFGDSAIMILDGDEHLRQRRLTGPALRGEHMRGHVETVTDETAREIATWSIGAPFPIVHALERVAFRILMQTIFGVRDAGRLTSFEGTFVEMVRNTAHRPIFSVLMWTTSSWDRYSPAFRRCRDALDELVFGEIASCRAAGPQGDTDVLSRLLQARDDEGRAMSDREVRDKLVELLLTGYVTTATTVTWLVERALRTPGAMEQLEAAVDADDDAYVDAAVQESLRVRPPVPQAFRRAASPFEIDGVQMRPGDLLAVCIYLLHMNEEAFAEPTTFVPERFLGDDQQRTGYVHVPFGGGVRRCIGAAFAIMETRYMVKQLVRQVRLRPDGSADEQPKRVGPVFQPHRGGRVIVTERRA